MIAVQRKKRSTASPWLTVSGAILGGALTLAGTPAAAQYISDVSIVEGADIPQQEELDQNHDEARWRLGTLKIEPFLGLRDASLVTNQDPDTLEEDDTDFTATVGAGLRVYTRPSAKVLVAAHALPDYVWWQDDSDRSRLNLNLGAGVFGHLNRLEFELSFRRTEEQNYFSSELPILQVSERDLLKAAIAVELARGIEVYAVVRDIDVASSDEDLPIFARTDRSEQRLAVGIRLESRGGLWADVAYEDSEVDFAPDARALSNEGSTIGVGLGFEKSKSSGSVRVAFRDVEPIDSSEYVPFDDVTALADLTWQPNRRLGLLAFARREQNFALDFAQSYYLLNRYGLSARLGLGSGFLQLTYALGEDDYESDVTSFDRVDDVEEISAQLSFPVGSLLVVSVTGSFSDYDSNLDGRDRDITAYGVSVQLGSIAEKLRLGRDTSGW